MKMLYIYNELNGELFCSQSFDGGNMPTNATLIIPPAVSENETPIFKNGEWVVVKDYRFTHKMINSNNEIQHIVDLGEIPEDWQLIKNEDAEKIEEQNRINNLTMTALDFIKFLMNFGITSEQIEDYLNQNISIKHQLQYCQNVYCGVVKTLVPLTLGGITITAEMVEHAFRVKNNDYEQPKDVIDNELI